MLGFLSLDHRRVGSQVIFRFMFCGRKVVLFVVVIVLEKENYFTHGFTRLLCGKESVVQYMYVPVQYL